MEKSKHTYLTQETFLNQLMRKEDEQSWDEFVSNYGQFIHSIIKTFDVFEQYRDDLFQDILLKIWSSIGRFNRRQKQGAFRNWIYTIAKNTIITFYMREKVSKRNQTELSSNAKIQFNSSEIEQSIEEEWNLHISTLAFRNISKKVSPTVLEAFIAQFNEESAEETAERLGYDMNTLYVYRARIKNKLSAEVANLKKYLE